MSKGLFNSYYFYILALLALLSSMDCNAKVVLTATNTTQHQRQEVVAWNAKEVWQQLGVKEGSSLIVKNPYGQTVTHQITHDGRLLLDVSVRPKGTAEFTVEQGNSADFKSYVFGKQYAWRVDDITWENDIAAYRVYGPALQRSGEKAYGIDVWLKSTKELDVDHRYAVTWQSNIDKAFFRSIGNKEGVDFVDRATSFHLDHGQGLDCYNVGPSLGCGTPALMLGDSLVMPYCYKDYEILDNGPLEFTLSLTYPTVNIAGQNVTEHRLISLAKGSNFNRMTVWYDGMTRPMDIAGGFVVHTSASEDLTLGKDFIAYDDPTDSYERHNFQIYVAAIFPEGGVKTRFVPDHNHLKQGIYGNAVGVKRSVKAGEKFSYRFGASWCQSGTPDHDFWMMQIERFKHNIGNPIITSIK